MTFKTIHTRYGLSAMSSAAAAGTPINLTHMAVGDGNGNPVDPDWEQTQLLRERYRAPINRVYQSPTDPTRFTAEMVVPATEGGWTMRELAVFDAAGSMFVVGNLPGVYKPLPVEGSFGDAVLRLEFAVTNADVVTLLIDPAVATASQAWVVTNVTAALIIPGGTVGQLLGKSSNTDGAYEWQSPDAINVTVDTIAEKQLLAASQTLVDLALTTTYGLAVYVDGIRLDLGSAAGEWQADPATPTRVILGQSYPAGTRITLVNNEPAGSAAAPLERAQNLADVLDKAQGRANLDIFSKAEARQLAPAGLIAHFARNSAPAGWLKANGSAISRSAYADLYAALGTVFGPGDGFTTFNLPDLRGEFIRGWDDARGVDGGRAFGSSQAGSIQSHAHTGSSDDAGNHAHSGSANAGGAHNHAASSGAAGSHAHTKTYQYVAGGALNYGFVYNDPNTYHGGGDSRSSGGNKTMQVSTAADHAHAISIGTAGRHAHSLAINTAGAHSHAITINAAGDAETRPRNLALLACVKF